MDPRKTPDRAAFITDDELRAYLADSLPPSDMARVEKALRDSAELRDRLEQVRHNRPDTGVHTLGAIWRRQRLTCPTRAQLGNYLLDILNAELTDYITFHIEICECPFCGANLADLRDLAAAAASAPTQSFRERIFHSSLDLLGS